MNPLSLGVAVFSFGMGIWYVKEDSFPSAIFMFGISAINAGVGML